MKRFINIAMGLAAIAALTGSCAKNVATGTNDLNKRYFDAWLKTHHPDAARTALGAYIIEDTPGTGELLGNSESTPFIYASCTITDLDGNVSSTDSRVLAQQIGSYKESNYYGPGIVSRLEGRSYAGVNDVLSTMRVGGTRKAVIPGWLISTSVFDKEEDYLNTASGTDAIYTFTVEEAIKDLEKWELDSIARYMARTNPGVDTVVTGFYYVQTKEPLDTSSFSTDVTVYLNYTGRLLNGQVFDTTIKDTAKVHGIYSASRDYKPTTVKWDAEDFSKITMGDDESTVVTGFSRLVSMMKAGEEGFAVFYSPYGYSASGSGSSIPAYSPLIFEIQLLGRNEDGSIDEKK